MAGVQRVSSRKLRATFFFKRGIAKEKTGMLGSMFPPYWVDPAKTSEAVEIAMSRPLTQSIHGSPTLLVITYNSRKRAPASRGDVLGLMSLGCLMQNMWIMAQSLGIGLQILSYFSAPPVETELKKLLGVPEYMKIA
jgi:nitroreductase